MVELQSRHRQERGDKERKRQQRRWRLIIITMQAHNAIARLLVAVVVALACFALQRHGAHVSQRTALQAQLSALRVDAVGSRRELQAVAPGGVGGPQCYRSLGDATAAALREAHAVHAGQEAMARRLDNLTQLLESKADAARVLAAIAGKADSSDLAALLATKADVGVVRALAAAAAGRVNATVVAALSARLDAELAALAAGLATKANASTAASVAGILGAVSDDLSSDEPLTLDNVTDSIVPLIAAKLDTATLDALRESLASLASASAVDALLAQIAARVLATQPAAEVTPCRCAPCADTPLGGELCSPWGPAMPCDCIDTSLSADPVRQTFPVAHGSRPCCRATLAAAKTLTQTSVSVPQVYSESDVHMKTGGELTFAWSGYENVEQVDDFSSLAPVPSGIRSGAPANGGSFSHVFGAPGEYFFCSTVHTSLRAKVTVTDCVSCLVVAGYAGPDPAAASLALQSRAAGDFWLETNSSSPNELAMTYLTVHADQTLVLSGVPAPLTDQLPILDASITVRSGGELVVNSTYVSGGVTMEAGSYYRTTPCGDEVADAWDGEQCDAGRANADVPDAPCRTDCTLPRCGDGIRDSGEFCDEGQANAANGTCGLDCQPTCVCPDLTCRTVEFRTSGGWADSGGPFTIDGCGGGCGDVSDGLVPEECYSDDNANCALNLCLAADLKVSAGTTNCWAFDTYIDGVRAVPQAGYCGVDYRGSASGDAWNADCQGSDTILETDESRHTEESWQRRAGETWGELAQSIRYAGDRLNQSGVQPYCGTRNVTYSCASGTIQGGDASRNCLADGTWDGTSPTYCGCPALGVASGVDISYSNHKLVGSVATHSCGAGSVQGGDVNRTCQADGSWDGTSPTWCGCPHPPTVSGVAIAHDAQPAVESVVTYTCGTGELQGGDANRTCQTDGSWDGIAPAYCGCPGVPAVPPPPPTYECVSGKYCNNHWNRNPSRWGNSGVRWISGESNLVAWCDAEPACRAYDMRHCTTPPCSNGRPCTDLSTGNNNDYKMCTRTDWPITTTYSNDQAVGSLATYTCSTGAVQGPEPGRCTGVVQQSRVCELEGTWGGNPPTRCGCPTLPGLSGVTIAYSSDQTVGSVATYTCGAGELQGGDATRECQADGTWDGAEPPNLLGDTVRSYEGVGNTWVRLFRQTNGNFRSAADWVRYNADANASATEDFSILDTLEDYRQADGFTLKLVWPLMSPANTTGDNQQVWKQTNNPVTDTIEDRESCGGVTGYVPIDINFASQRWGGLERNLDMGFSLLDGSVDFYFWFYAVGTTRPWRGAIPGPNTPGPNAIAEESVELYVRSSQSHCGCPELPAVSGMNISYSNGRMFPSTAQYSCLTAEAAIGGNATRKCQADGSWSGAAPTLCKQCGAVFGSASAGVFAGGNPGDGLDLTGDFLHAVDVYGSGGVTAGDAAFTGDVNVAGVNVVAQYTRTGWGPRDFGSTPGDDALEHILNSHRWSRHAHGESVIAQLGGLTAGDAYRLQLLFSEGCCDRAFDVLVDGLVVFDDFSPNSLDQQNSSLGAYMSLDFVACDSILAIELGGDCTGTFSQGCDPFLKGLTLEALRCPELPAVGNMTISYTNGLAFPTTAKYTCDDDAPGTTANGGDATRECQSDGSWAGTPPTYCGCPSLPSCTGHVTITADNAYSLYINGVHQSNRNGYLHGYSVGGCETTTNSYDDLYTGCRWNLADVHEFAVSSPLTIAVDALDVGGNGALIANVAVNGVEYPTNGDAAGAWRCFHSSSRDVGTLSQVSSDWQGDPPPHGWMSGTFNDSSWSVPFEWTSHTWGWPAGVGAARWIWESSDRSHNDIYCRMSVACDESAPTGRSTNHSDELAVGSVATFSCDVGTVQGIAARTCQADGSWAPDPADQCCLMGYSNNWSAEQGSARGTGVGQVMWEIGSNHVYTFDSCRDTCIGLGAAYFNFFFTNARGDCRCYSQEQGQSSAFADLRTGTQRIDWKFCPTNPLPHYCTADGWLGDASTNCGCPPLPAVDGMGVEYTDHRQVGSVATHSCDAGVLYGGDESLTCQADGTWSSSDNTWVRLFRASDGNIRPPADWVRYNVAPTPFGGTWHLAPPGDIVCDYGVNAAQSECEAAGLFLAQQAGETPARTLQEGSGGHCGSWGLVPIGCSVQSGGDWAACYKPSGTMCYPRAAPQYQLVCSTPNPPPPPVAPTAEDYSILDTLEDYRHADGTFTLKLVWPHMSPENSTGDNQQVWKQTNNPVFGAPGGVQGTCAGPLGSGCNGGVTGYEAIDIHFNGSSWGGLEYNGENALLDGSVGDGQWFFAVGGAKNISLLGGQSSLPGPQDKEQSVELFVLNVDTPMYCGCPSLPDLSGGGLTYSDTPGCQRGLRWCTNAAGEGGNCCSEYSCDLDRVRTLNDPGSVAARRPICWYSGGDAVGDVDWDRATIATYFATHQAVGSVATHSCDTGALQGGDENRTCLANFSWDGGARYCGCPALPAPAGTRVTYPYNCELATPDEAWQPRASKEQTNPVVADTPCEQLGNGNEYITLSEAGCIAAAGMLQITFMGSYPEAYEPEMHHGCSVLKSAGHLQDWDWVYYVPNGNRAGPDTTTLPGEFGAFLCGSRYKCAPAAPPSARPGVGSVAALACDGGALQGNVANRTCQANGTWSGAWNDCTCPWRLLARGSAGNVRLPAEWVSYNSQFNGSATEDFSILGTLEDYRQADGFTLKIVRPPALGFMASALTTSALLQVWPLMSPENETGVNQNTWRQTNNPVTDTVSNGGVTVRIARCI